MPNFLSKEDFYKSLELSPRLTVELLISNTDGSLLLIPRANNPFKGFWHLPGGFLLKDEKISACSERLSISEVGLGFGKGEFVGRIFETIGEDVRDGVSAHILHYCIRFPAVDLNMKLPMGAKWFEIIPEKTIPYQAKFLCELGYK